jgi:hypothetical protein
MINWKEVPVPSRIQKNCVRDKRGLYVPYIVAYDENKPLFTINDIHKVLKCVVKNLCTICGEKMYDDMWLIGGPASAFHAHGAFNDAPVHKECGVYALKVCPYLAYSKYNSKLDFEKMQEKYEGKFILENATMDSDRLPLFCFVKIRNYTYRREQGTVRPLKPYLEVEYWNDGEQLKDEDAKEIIIDLFNEKYTITDLILEQ